MKQRKLISVILGTRPEAIKLAPVILALRRDRRFRCQVCVTAQHRQMLDQVLALFGIEPDSDLDLMVKDQSLAAFTSRAVAALDSYLAGTKPDLVLVQGDTTTVFAATLAAFYRRVPVGHIEAGLRTGNLQSPWPEELNRVLTSRMASLHFAPTPGNRRNLRREGIPASAITVTGNTVIDALFLALARVRKTPPVIPGLPAALQPSGAGRPPSSRLVLITGHRRENFGKGFENICRAIAELSQRFPSVHFVYPVHLNPNVREPVMRLLRHADHTRTGAKTRSFPNVHLIEPLDYLAFVALMDRAELVLTDSGGVQEEAPSLGKPVLVMRDTTERPEAVTAGTVKLVGTARQSIVAKTAALLGSTGLYRRMSQAHNPYGDGQATPRILDACHRFFT